MLATPRERSSHDVPGRFIPVTQTTLNKLEVLCDFITGDPSDESPAQTSYIPVDI